MPTLSAAKNSAATSPRSRYDAVLAVGPSKALQRLRFLREPLEALGAVDASAGEGLHFLAAPGLAGGRLVVSCTGPLDRDQDDVRRFADAGAAALRRARAAGSRRPLLVVTGLPEDEARFARAVEAAALGGLGAIWEPLEAREALGEGETEPIEELGLVGVDDDDLDLLRALEAGRRAARDIGGTEPERMAPPRMAEYCQELFADTPVTVEVVEDETILGRDYPLLAAVARASMAVARHRPRVVRLAYRPKGKVRETWLLAGKGLSYDTGGADLKVGGHMAGMSRDKGGGAAVIGFLKTVAILRPKGVAVIAEIGCVRNSIGAESYVTDEIIRSHAGVRVRIGNTDAEGRLVLADLLSHLREEALDAVEPRLFSVATLTGHAVLAAGPYSIALDNRPALDLGVSRGLQDQGEIWGDPFEVSRLRREDWDFIAPKSRADDVLSCNNAPSSQTPRGHQFPMAFLARASGLADHGPDARLPLAYTHLDVAGSANEGSDWQHGRPTGAPIVALTAMLRDGRHGGRK
ncbi:MAG: leucyl aminopeptidase family protein [Planctomycetes bacterium]|nr:leucyl aminopeptidase family protein [Planctomycetota bacterium]